MDGPKAALVREALARHLGSEGPGRWAAWGIVPEHGRDYRQARPTGQYLLNRLFPMVRGLVAIRRWPSARQVSPARYSSPAEVPVHWVRDGPGVEAFGRQLRHIGQGVSALSMDAPGRVQVCLAPGKIPSTAPGKKDSFRVRDLLRESAVFLLDLADEAARAGLGLYLSRAANACQVNLVFDRRAERQRVQEAGDPDYWHYVQPTPPSVEALAGVLGPVEGGLVAFVNVAGGPECGPGAPASEAARAGRLATIPPGYLDHAHRVPAPAGGAPPGLTLGALVRHCLDVELDELRPGALDGPEQVDCLVDRVTVLVELYLLYRKAPPSYDFYRPVIRAACGQTLSELLAEYAADIGRMEAEYQAGRLTYPQFRAQYARREAIYSDAVRECLSQ